MLVNYNISESGTEHVQLVSYTGCYPCLCSGVLTLLIDGEEVKFGHDSFNYDYATHKYNDGNYDKFWESGGHLDRDYIAHKGEWEIDITEIPEQYRKYATEIDIVFNCNVPYGCCGGCA